MAESGRVLVEFEILTVDATDTYEKWWLDEVEKDFGVRPVIYEKLVATEEVGHHACSFQRSAQVFVVEIMLANYHEFEESDGNADQIERNIQQSQSDSGRYCEYIDYSEFWKTDFVEREPGGLFNYDEMYWGAACDMAHECDGIDIDDLEWATEDEKKQMEDYWNKEDDCEKATVEAT